MNERASGSDLARLDATTDEDIAHQIAEDPESVPENTDDDLARGRFRKLGRPRLDKPKQQVSLRLDPDVIERLKATGKGWQGRVNDILRRSLDDVA